MTNWKALLAAPAAFGIVAAVSGNAVAAEAVAVEEISSDVSADVVVEEPVQLAQVTSVSELSDVQPGDWAFTALQRLVEEYGCLEGYPDRTYRGNRALTRYEFAAGLNACLDVVIQLIGGDDLDEIRRLQEEFAAELATIRGRVDTLETDVAELEANQFSTTTKLRGALDANLVVPFGDADLTTIDVGEGDDGLIGTADDEITTIGGDEADATFEYRATLNFDTSFTGEDRLRVRLRATDAAGSLANSENGLASQSGRRNGLEDNLGLDDVYYSFPIGNRISGIIAANSVVTDDFVTSTIVPFDGPSVADAGGPEFYDQFAGGDFGAGVNFAFSDNLVLDLGYSSDSSNNNTEDGGLFNENSYIAQLNFLTDGIFDAAITYIGAGDADDGDAESTIAGLINFDFGGFQVGGHYANTQVDGEDDIDSYMGGVAFSDFLGAGNEFGVYGGISPAVDRDPVLVEAYYEINVNEFFSFTPAIIYTDNDSDGDENDNVYGAVRASFSF
ncbi:MAG: iron uptake porin [Phormidesmis sp.]